MMVVSRPLHHTPTTSTPAAVDYTTGFDFEDQSSPNVALYHQHHQHHQLHHHSLTHHQYHHLQPTPYIVSPSSTLSHPAAYPSPAAAHLMHAGHYNPPIRVHQSTPSPGPLPNQHLQPYQQQHCWQEEGTNATAHLAPHGEQHALNYPSHPHGGAGHKRKSSGSTVASAGPHSPYTPLSAAFPQVIETGPLSYGLPGGDGYDVYSLSRLYQKPPPVSTTTFTDSLLAPRYHDYASSSHHVEGNPYLQLAMRQAIMNRQESDASCASMAPPRTNGGGDLDDCKLAGESRNTMPKLDRTMSDIYQDALYNPNMTCTPAPAPVPAPVLAQNGPPAQNKLLSPRRDVFSERLQAANNDHMSARSASPASTISRERSPFQPSSAYASDPILHNKSPINRLGSAARMRERQKAEADAAALAQQDPSTSLASEEAQTISPKEALLDYKEEDDDARMPLFPQEPPRKRIKDEGSPYAALKPIITQESTRSDFSDFAQQGIEGAAAMRRGSSSNQSSVSAPAQQSAFDGGQSGAQVPQQYPFIAHPRRQPASAGAGEPGPEFKPHLTSMETSKSESAIPSSQEWHSPSDQPAPRPAVTTADPGTYTCTYHGCTMRFESPQKLQKHKRDGHRQNTPQSATVSHTSQSLAERNSQAGPHKCERINPSTGKPCSSVFSRPYDLTRHEDTIHNARKQKVRCQFCTEEKTFSRNDALTRHMRVVHPDVDFPGKHKRKGGS